MRYVCVDFAAVVDVAYDMRVLIDNSLQLDADYVVDVVVLVEDAYSAVGVAKLLDLRSASIEFGYDDTRVV